MDLHDPTPPRRCGWCGGDPLYVAYHDHEWGVPVHDEHRLFELLTLEGAQAGLSWLTVLRKRERYRAVFAGFVPERIVGFGEPDMARLLADPGIIRHRGKIEATVNNARAWLELKARHGSAESFLWRYVDGTPRINAWHSLAEVPAKTVESAQMSRDLKRQGFRFTGPTLCYAFMQASGLVNDHLTDCFRHGAGASRRPARMTP